MAALQWILACACGCALSAFQFLSDHSFNSFVLAVIGLDLSRETCSEWSHGSVAEASRAVDWGRGCLDCG